MVANPERGEIAFKVDGVERILRFTINEIIALEVESEGKDFFAIMDEAIGGKSVNLKMLRHMVKVGLSRSWPEVTDELAGDAMHQIGLAKTIELFVTAVRYAFPEAMGDASPKPAAAAGKKPTG